MKYRFHSSNYFQRILLNACIYLITLYPFFGLAQEIKGNLINLKNEEISIKAFNGFNSYTVNKVKIDSNGDFILTYGVDDFGIGYLLSGDQTPFFVVLNGEDIELIGESLSSQETIKVIRGAENLILVEYAHEHSKRQQALSAWIFLKKIYTVDSLFSKHTQTLEAVADEIIRIKTEDDSNLEQLQKQSYISWFLPKRKLLSSVQAIAQYRQEEIEETISQLRAFDFTDDRLYKSGLFKDAIENHFWLIENSGKTLDSVYNDMYISIDILINNISNHSPLLNEITEYLFDLLERQSLFKASEYLALKILNQENCTINENLVLKLESYRAMKKGNIAPDIHFNSDYFAPGYPEQKFPNKLSDINYPYKLVVFGGSSCPKCVEELPEISKLYIKWKNHGLEVVYVSLDIDKTIFENFTRIFPFISICDYQQWAGKTVKDYFVFATPTFYLLNQNNEILNRPISVKQVDAWVDWHLLKTN